MSAHICFVVETSTVKKFHATYYGQRRLILIYSGCNCPILFLFFKAMVTCKLGLLKDKTLTNSIKTVDKEDKFLTEL